MRSVRFLLTRFPLLAAALLLFGLLARVLIPAGFMPVASGGGVTLQPCPGTMPAAPAPMAGMHHGGAKHDVPAKAEQPCAFAGLAVPALGSADRAMVAAVPAFVFLIAILASVAAPPVPPAYLRPPLRAPPLPA